MTDDTALAAAGGNRGLAPVSFRRQIALAEAWLDAGDDGCFEEAIAVLRNAYKNSKSPRTRIRAADILLRHGARIAEIDRQKDHGLQFGDVPAPAESAPAQPIQVNVLVNLNRPTSDDVAAALRILADRDAPAPSANGHANGKAQT